MADLHLTLPDELSSQLQSRAMESGYDSVEHYAQAVLRANGAPQAVDEDVEELLVSRLDDPRPDIELTPKFKDEFRAQLQERRRRQGRNGFS